MNIIDLHCDTLYKALTMDRPLDDSSMEVHLNTDNSRSKLQCYAIWLPDDIGGEQAKRMTEDAALLLQNECDRCGIHLIRPGESIAQAMEQHADCAYFTIENALALAQDISNVRRFAALGVRMMTLTWNAQNPLGGGADCDLSVGLSDFGREVVTEMEKQHIIVDVSHANETTFYDVLAAAGKPVVCSHSNAYAVTAHRRNLKDYQLRLLIERGGLTGLNFHNAFLHTNPDEARITDILRHAEHILSLGGEDVLCFGSDFDGGVLPQDIADSSVYDALYELFLRENYKEELIRKIFFKNALNFCENFDKQRNM